MGAAKSKIIKSLNSHDREDLCKPGRYFIDNQAIDLDKLQSAGLCEDLGQDIWCVHYEMNDGNWYDGESSSNKRLIENRLALALTNLNRWNLYKMSLLSQAQK